MRRTGTGSGPGSGRRRARLGERAPHLQRSACRRGRAEPGVGCGGGHGVPEHGGAPRRTWLAARRDRVSLAGPCGQSGSGLAQARCATGSGGTGPDRAAAALERVRPEHPRHRALQNCSTSGARGSGYASESSLPWSNRKMAEEFLSVAELEKVCIFHQFFINFLDHYLSNRYHAKALLTYCKAASSVPDPAKVASEDQFSKGIGGTREDHIAEKVSHPWMILVANLRNFWFVVTLRISLRCQWPYENDLSGFCGHCSRQQASTT